MSHFDIVRQSNPAKSFRVASVMGTYDLQTEHINERFVGDIDLPDTWNVGLIVGRSGTGKTTIATELFSDKIYRGGQNYTHECLLDDMPSDATMSEIYQALTAVGFASPPDWLKSYHVLSNGEKMRCDIARAMLENKEMFVFDEFTSVVDRNIAKVASLAIQKAIRKNGRKFIAVTCHHDVQEWLMPDWVFNTDTMTFSTYDLEEQKKNRPAIQLDIVETGHKLRYWEMFKKYHYLTGEFNVAAKTWLCFVNGNLAGFCSFLAFPHPKIKNIYKAHRVVVFPDYQGIGVASNMLKICADELRRNGKKVKLTSSNIAMIMALKKSKWWKCTRIGRMSKPANASYDKGLAKSFSCNKITAAFEYLG
jgi:ABC-type ATPase with predicted acetyltransferase domain